MSNLCVRFFSLLVIVAILPGCKNSDSVKPKLSDQPSNKIYVVSFPLAAITNSLVSSDIEVVNVASTTGDPQTTRPSRETIVAMQSGDLIVVNGTGATYANWLQTVSLPESKIVATASQGLSLSDYIAVENEQVVHSHGPEGEHSHPVMASRVWQDPKLAKKQATYIVKQLVDAYPDKADVFNANLKSLSERLDGLNTKFELLAAESLKLMTTGSSLKFMSRAMGADDVTIKPDQFKSDDELTKAIVNLEFDFALLFEGSELDANVEDALTASGIEMIRVNSLDHQTDYFGAIERNLDVLLKACGLDGK